MAIRSDAYKGSRNSKNDDELLKQKISQIQEFTQCSEDYAFMTLHDCDYNVEVAVNKILCQDQTGESEWCKSQKKSKKSLKSDKHEIIAHEPTNVENVNNEVNVVPEPPPISRQSIEGKCFKNYDLMKDFKPIQCHTSLPSTSPTFIKYDQNKVWDEKTVIIYNPNYFSSNFNIKKAEIHDSDKASQISHIGTEISEESIVFKTRCSTKPPPKSIYTLSSPVQIMNKPPATFYNSSAPRFKFGDSEIEDSLSQLDLQSSKSDAQQIPVPTSSVRMNTTSNLTTQSHISTSATNFTNISTHTNQLLKDYYFPNSGFMNSHEKVSSVSNKLVKSSYLIDNSELASSNNKEDANTIFSQNNYSNDEENNEPKCTKEANSERLLVNNSLGNTNNVGYHQNNEMDMFHTNLSSSTTNPVFQPTGNPSNSATNASYNSGNLYLVPNLMMNGYYMALNNSAAVTQSQFVNQPPASLTHNHSGTSAPSQPFPSHPFAFPQHSPVYPHHNDSLPDQNMHKLHDKKELAGAQLLQQLQSSVKKVVPQPLEETKRYEYFSTGSPPLPAEFPHQFVGLSKAGLSSYPSHLGMQPGQIYLAPTTTTTSASSSNVPAGPPPHNMAAPAPGAPPPHSAVSINNATTQLFLNSLHNNSNHPHHHHHQVPNQMQQQQHSMNSSGYDNMKKQHQPQHHQTFIRTNVPPPTAAKHQWS